VDAIRGWVEIPGISVVQAWRRVFDNWQVESADEISVLGVPTGCKTTGTEFAALQATMTAGYCCQPLRTGVTVRAAPLRPRRTSI
jgi:hypothetical protein